MNADSEKEKKDLSYLVTLQGRPMTSGSRPQETGRPVNYPKKELYVCWGRHQAMLLGCSECPVIEVFQHTDY